MRCAVPAGCPVVLLRTPVVPLVLLPIPILFMDMVEKTSGDSEGGKCVRGVW